MRFKAAIAVIGVVAIAGALWLALRPSRESDTEASATAAAPDLRPCAVDARTAGYVSEKQLQKLRDVFRADGSGGLADGLSPAQKQILAAALTRGTTDAAFAARVVRSLEIVRELELQKTCTSATRCEVTGDPADYALAALIKTGASDDPNKARPWTDLAADWRLFLKQDIDRGKACLSF